MDNLKKKQFSKILHSISEELDLTPSQYEDARKKYEAAGNWLSKPECSLFQFSPQIYPQGSIRLGTAVKPLGRDEFDVDLVCEMDISESVDQAAVMKAVKNRLEENEYYKSILVPKKRCVELNFKGSFHMDILPAIPDETKGNCCLLVPDREMKIWMPSNPKGYADWFGNRMVVIMESLRKAATADIEPLPDNNVIRTPLQRAVQIIKRQRDIRFADSKDLAPISIVITTLAAKAYNNEPDLFDAIINIIEGMPHQINSVYGFPAVLNPTNKDENFAEKWRSDPRLYEIFQSWLSELKEQLFSALKNRSVAFNDSLAPMFGESLTKKALTRYAGEIESKRESGLLKMASGTGILGTTGTTVRRNTFYGGK